MQKIQENATLALEIAKQNPSLQLHKLQNINNEQTCSRKILSASLKFFSMIAIRALTL